MIQLYAIASSGLKRWLKPARNEAYKRWIKRFPCLACGSTYMVDPAHTGPHGFGSRSSDYSCIPLCRKCHPEFDAAPRQFASEREWSIAEIVTLWNHLWFLKTGNKVGVELEKAA